MIRFPTPLTVLLPGMALASGRPALGQATFGLVPDSMNLAILVVDFTTYRFEKASLARYPLCDDCDRDSLPFRTAYKSPGDFGEIRFLYSETGQLLFGAGIIWDGTGKRGSQHSPADGREDRPTDFISSESGQLRIPGRPKSWSSINPKMNPDEKTVFFPHRHLPGDDLPAGPGSAPLSK